MRLARNTVSESQDSPRPDKGIRGAHMGKRGKDHFFARLKIAGQRRHFQGTRTGRGKETIPESKLLLDQLPAEPGEMAISRYLAKLLGLLHAGQFPSVGIRYVKSDLHRWRSFTRKIQKISYVLSFYW
jgi:hypothetical protein